MIERNVYTNFVEYTSNGLYHRPNGPALHDKSEGSWYLYGNMHRYYGPQSTVFCSWWVHGNYVDR
jgi:hypothetical protein